MIVSLLRQLVKGAGVREEDISVGDPLSLFPNQYTTTVTANSPASTTSITLAETPGTPVPA